MNTHDKINRLIDKLEAIPAMDFAARSKGFHDLRAAIEADRQSRDCGQCVPLSTDGKSVFIDGVGEVPLDFGGQARGNAVAPAVSSTPVAWYTDDHLTDKSATTWDRTVAARWRDKGWSVGELFAAPQPSTEGG